MENKENKNIKAKNKVGRPKGTTNKIGVKTGRPKLKNIVETYNLQLKINEGEKELIETIFKMMNLDENKKGSKKKMFFRLMNDFIEKN